MTIEHKLITDPLLHEPKGVSSASTDTVYVATGTGTGTWKVLPSTFDPTNIKSVNLIQGTSLAVSQDPTGTDAPMQVEFGAGQGTGTDPVSLATDGTVTINTAGTYRLKTQAQLGRVGGTGVSRLFFRATINGIQSGNSIFEKFDDADVTRSIIDCTWGELPAGATIKYELLRDSSGDDSGSLRRAATTLGGWNAAPTASIIIERLEK